MFVYIERARESFSSIFFWKYNFEHCAPSELPEFVQALGITIAPKMVHALRFYLKKSSKYYSFSKKIF